MIDDILRFREKNKRPIILEVSGTPNAGKTYAIEIVKKRFDKDKVSSTVLYEAAKRIECIDKLSPVFNYWTLCETIKTLLPIYLSPDYNLIICERGLFDHICWFDFFNARGFLDDNKYEIIKKYIQCMQQEIKTDIVISFHCDEEIAVRREAEGLGTLNNVGSRRIVNTEVISEFNRAKNRIIAQNTDSFLGFPKVVTIDSTNYSKKDLIQTFEYTMFNEIATLV